MNQSAAASTPDQLPQTQQVTHNEVCPKQKHPNPVWEDKCWWEESPANGKRKKAASITSIASVVKSEPPEDYTYKRVRYELQREEPSSRARDNDKETQCTTDYEPVNGQRSSSSGGSALLNNLNPGSRRRTSFTSSAALAGRNPPYIPPSTTTKP